MEEMYAGSWNNTQRMPHREPLAEYLKSFYDCYIEKKPQDWVLLCVGTYKEVGDALTAFEKVDKRAHEVSTEVSREHAVSKNGSRFQLKLVQVNGGTGVLTYTPSIKRTCLGCGDSMVEDTEVLEILMDRFNELLEFSTVVVADTEFIDREEE